ncbi:Diaminobutyrate--2-oxoglutarate transaminase (Diaminobutyrate--2-oxoglutarate aminotransferase) (L-2,4-diaminobutyric acid transaminase) (DABA aminotransferase) [Bradyrhizobium sp. ORS 375]|uniref:diaminobutyrate--2-oxoglutarate transaminase n=1 Tax=Bradyrhizobium sp. (strain ORS 375) TaxID=566679 RepID=UPI0002407010|nr:diaminobutyrate--2-oxoglutarate transaminase [Bradyrhizobium sp. ORS 375]CCD96740.1 Diaminobutyrate--2-oxoglutarate transaminase (Diaminobutyrate--2-oxoglutarate aminotransferase) (L-2,4-diaminobutyric acid transaminase) (DABA aminotransferase) [Bradyrhizobium sp. ORS 375]
MQHVSDAIESNVRYYCRSFPADFSRARGSYMWDTTGRQYIDLFSGAGALNYGHNPPEIKQQLLDYIAADGIVHGLDLRTEAKNSFLSDFSSLILSPKQLEYRLMFPGPTGTNAVEAALKLARKVTGRANVACFTNGFHGMSLGALATTGSRRKRRGAGAPLSLGDRYPYDNYFGATIDTIDLISTLLRDPSSGFDPPAAFLVETVQGEGGAIAASFEWLKQLAGLATEHGSLLIVDDIQAGCGRTGHFLSFEPAGIYPDVVCLSKSISGFGLPMSLLLIKPRHDVFDPGEHNGTFRGHNLAFVAGRAALAYWRDPGFLRALDQNIALLDEWLSALVERLPRGAAEVRGRGLLRGLAFADDRLATIVARKAFQRDIIIEVSGSRDDVLKFLPALNIPSATLIEALGRLEEIIELECLTTAGDVETLQRRAS